LLVEADEQVDQLAAHGPGAEQARQLREVDEPLRIPRCPVIVGPVDDPEDLVVSLARLMQQTADLLQCACHLVPPRLAGRGRHVAAPNWPLLASSRSSWPVSACDSQHVTVTAVTLHCSRHDGTSGVGQLCLQNDGAFWS
jgi:hypothetical protein